MREFRSKASSYSAEVPSIMAASDIGLGKAGAMTLAEHLVSELPFITRENHHHRWW